MADSKPKSISAGDRSEAFLVRVWREPSESRSAVPLRISARQLRTGETRHFAEIEELHPYLISKI